TVAGDTVPPDTIAADGDGASRWCWAPLVGGEVPDGGVSVRVPGDRRGASGFIDPYSSRVQRQAFEVLVKLHAGGEVTEPDIVHLGLSAVQAAEGVQVLGGQGGGIGLAGRSGRFEL